MRRTSDEAGMGWRETATAGRGRGFEEIPHTTHPEFPAERVLLHFNKRSFQGTYFRTNLQFRPHPKAYVTSTNAVLRC
jgi:hypothetical protein